MKYINISRAIGLCLYFCGISCDTAAQSNWLRADGVYEDYLDYKRWGIHYNNVMYAPAYARKTEGVYDIDTKPMRGKNFGFSYTFRRNKQLSYYTGLDMDFIPFYYFYAPSFHNDAPDPTVPVGIDYYKHINDHNVITMPLGIAWKSPFNKKKSTSFYYHAKADIRFHFIQSGQMSIRRTVDRVSLMYLYGRSKPINILSPTINLALGIDWLTKFAIIHANLNFQKGIVPYLQGEYFFHNLGNNVPDTRGIYKVRADYIGMDIGITPKKWGKRK